MTITAKIIADSISEAGKRITSLQLRYPRFIHAELMTHRVFSRNASSSRAIPVERLIQDIIEDTAMPIHWGKNQPGMQAHEECDHLITKDFITTYEGTDRAKITRNGSYTREDAWFAARDQAIDYARCFDKAGYHKQIVNRLLEPFSHINVIVTATEFDNFFALRCHPDAQPEIRELATKMRTEMGCSTPRLLKINSWHLPYISDDDLLQIKGTLDNLIKCSVARCARVSYVTHDMKEPELEADLKLYERLVGSIPLHASPAEHQATPDKGNYVWHPTTHILEDGTQLPPTLIGWEMESQHGNFVGWQQWRKMIEI